MHPTPILMTLVCLAICILAKNAVWWPEQCEWIPIACPPLSPLPTVPDLQWLRGLFRGPPRGGGGFVTRNGAGGRKRRREPDIFVWNQHILLQRFDPSHSPPGGVLLPRDKDGLEDREPGTSTIISPVEECPVPQGYEQFDCIGLHHAPCISWMIPFWYWCHLRYYIWWYFFVLVEGEIWWRSTIYILWEMLLSLLNVADLSPIPFERIHPPPKTVSCDWQRPVSADLWGYCQWPWTASRPRNDSWRHRNGTNSNSETGSWFPQLPGSQ